MEVRINSIPETTKTSLLIFGMKSLKNVEKKCCLIIHIIPEIVSLYQGFQVIATSLIYI